MAVRAAAGDFPATCKLCAATGEDGRLTADARRNRIRWGCDEPAPQPIGAITCSACSGQAIDCPVCHGSGREPVLRCPWSTAWREVGPAMRFLLLAAEHRVYPEEGSLLDQAAAFLEAVGVVERELAVVREERARRG